MTRTKIHPGVCGFTTVVRAHSGDGQNVRLTIESECPDIRALGESLKEVDAYSAVFGSMMDSTVYKAASEHCSHAACPVPMGIIKTLEAACSLALPADVTVSISKEE